MDFSLPCSSVHGDSPGKNTGVGCHAPLYPVRLKLFVKVNNAFEKMHLKWWIHSVYLIYIPFSTGKDVVWTMAFTISAKRTNLACLSQRYEIQQWNEYKIMISQILLYPSFSSVQLLSPVWLCDPMKHSMPGLPVHHQLSEFTQTYVHQVGSAIQPSHPLSSPFPPAPNPSQHQSLFQWVNSSHEVAKVLEFQL